MQCNFLDWGSEYNLQSISELSRIN